MCTWAMDLVVRDSASVMVSLQLTAPLRREALTPGCASASEPVMICQCAWNRLRQHMMAQCCVPFLAKVWTRCECKPGCR